MNLTLCGYCGLPKTMTAREARCGFPQDHAKAASVTGEVTALHERIKDGLPVHYFDCDRFNVTNYGTRQGKCDCTATSDVEALLALRQVTA